MLMRTMFQGHSKPFPLRILLASLFMGRIRDVFVCICTSAKCECSPFWWPYQFRHRLLLDHITVKIVLDWSSWMLCWPTG